MSQAPDIGEIGVWTTLRALGRENAGEAAKLAEDLGYGAIWLGGSPRLPEIRPLLAATDRLVVATGIVNVWAYEPEELAADYAALVREFPDRILVGIGIGHPEATSEYAKPLTAMREFLDGLDRAEPSIPVDRRCVAALGPKMLDLSGERSLGTHPYFIPVEHTRFARERLGDGALVAPCVSCVVDPDADRARATARGFAAIYLDRRNYTNNLHRFGLGDEDIAGGGSDRLIEAVVPHGSPDVVAAAIRSHLDAGADHVCLQAAGIRGVPREEWTALAARLINSPSASAAAVSNNN